MNFDMLINCVFFLGLFANLGRDKTTVSLVGDYKTDHISIFQQYGMQFFKNTVYISGESLEIRQDSTYTLRNCNEMSGTWSVKESNLILVCRKNVMVRDTSRTLRCGTVPVKFEILHQNRLRLVEVASSDIKGFSKRPTLIMQLVKVK